MVRQAANPRLAQQLLDQGNVRDAEAMCRRLLRRQPRNVEAWRILAEIALRTGAVTDVVQIAEKMISMYPSRSVGHRMLAEAHLRVGRLGEAVAALRSVRERAPDDPTAARLLAGLLVNGQELDEAAEIYRELLEIDAGDAEAAAGLAVVLERTGDYDAAHALLRPHLEAGSPNLRLLWAYGRVAPHVDRCADAIERLEAVLPGCAEEHDRSQLCYMLAKLYDRAGDYDRAFGRLDEANRLDRAPDASGRIEQTVTNHIKTFTAAAFETMPRAARVADGPRLILIVGMPRSGTSLVEQILASHPDVHGAGELELIRDMTRTLSRRMATPLPYPQCVGRVTPQIVQTLREEHGADLDRLRGDCIWITDKFPENYLHLGVVSLLWPEVKIVHCRRHPLDTCISCFFEDFGRGHQYSRDLSALARQYGQYRRLMAHWVDVLPLPMLHFSYEELVDDLEGRSRQLLEFCGIPWDDGCLEFHRTDRRVLTHSYDQVRQPIYSRSVGRWRNYAEHLQPLIDGLRSAGVKLEDE